MKTKQQEASEWPSLAPHRAIAKKAWYIAYLDIQRIHNLKNTMKKRLNIRCTKDIIFSSNITQQNILTKKKKNNGSNYVMTYY